MSKFYEYFYGNKVSDYGIENGYVDYATLAKSFDAVLNNDIIEKTSDIGYWEQVSGFVDNSDEIEELRDKIDELQDKIYELQDKIDELETEQEESEQEEIDKLQEEIDKLQEEIDKLLDRIDELQEEQDDEPEIFQYYIISDNGADILERETNEIVFYNDELDMYVWGVTHWGTSWDYVLTDIPLEKEK